MNTQYKGPIELQDFVISIQSISNQELEAIKYQTNHQMERLIESNNLMRSLLNKELRQSKDDDDEFDVINDEDVEIYRDSIKENDFVINNQQQRIDAIDKEIDDRISLPKVKSINDIKMKTGENIGSTDNDFIDTTASNGIYM